MSSPQLSPTTTHGSKTDRVDIGPSCPDGGLLVAPIRLRNDDQGSPGFLLLAEHIDESCLETIRSLARSEDSLIVVGYTTGGSSEETRALRAGADECVPLGFSVERTLAQLRRLTRHRKSADTETRPSLRIDIARHEVRVNGQQVRLSPLEFRLLSELWSHSDRLVPHEHVERVLYGASGPADRQAVRQIAHRLRGKLGPATDAIRAVAGVGYVLSTEGLARSTLAGHRSGDESTEPALPTAVGMNAMRPVPVGVPASVTNVNGYPRRPCASRN